MLVDMFKFSNANQILFLKNKLKDIKKGNNEDIQSYVLRTNEINNDLLSIGEVLPDREHTLTTLGGLPPKWYEFITIKLNNDQIPWFEESMLRCIQEEPRMVGQEIPSNRSISNAFSTHANRKNNASSKNQSLGRLRLKNGRKGR